MSEARKLVELAKRRAWDAAHMTRAFEVGEIVSQGDGGSLNVHLPGMGTKEQVGRMEESPNTDESPVLLVRIGGDNDMTVAMDRAPYDPGKKADAKTITFNFEH